MIDKDLRKIIQRLFSLFCISKKKKYVQLIFQNITQPVEKKKLLLMIPNEEKEGRSHYLAVKRLSALLHRITSKVKDNFYCLNSLHSFRTENKS